MDEAPLDEIDRVILHALQEDARHNTNAEISERVSVPASTVGKRIARLEEQGIVRSYRPELDYERSGFPLQALFICTTPITERESLIEKALDVDGVVNVRELMTGRDNVHIQAVGTSNEEVMRIARTLDGSGYTVTDEILMRDEIETVADVEDLDPTELETTLFEVLDPEALDAFVRSTAENDTTAVVEFTYYGYELAVTGDGSVRVVGDA